MTRPDEIAALADEGCCETPLSHHVASFWNLLKTETVHLSVNIRRVIGHDAPAGPIVYYDCTTFGDEVAKELVRLSATSPSDAMRIDAAAAYLCRTVIRANWVGIYDGRAADKGFEPWVCHNARRDDFRDVVREIVRIAALAPAEKAGTDDSALRKAWEDAGGAFYGPNRNGVMREATLLPFLRSLSATPTPPSADVAKARVHADRIRWLLDNQPNALSFACEMHARARSIMESLDTLIQSAAPGGGHQSDGGDLSALPSGECEPVVTQAYPPSDPAQEPEAVALKPCPFCGSSDSFAERYDYSSTYVKCNNCSAHGPTELQEDDREETLGEEFAKRAWNTRPVSLDREALIRWVQSKDPANIGRKTGSQWADEILALIGGRT